MRQPKRGAKQALFIVTMVLLCAFFSFFFMLCREAYLPLCNPLFNKDAPTPEALGYARSLLLEKDDVKNALRLCEQVAQRDPDSFEAYRLLAMLNVDERIKRYDKALSAAHQAARLRPGSALSYFTLGVVYREMGRYEVALAHFRKALRSQPPPNQRERGVIYSTIASTLYEQGKFREAFWYMSRVAPSKRKFVWLADGYLRIGDLPLAEKYCRMALQHDAYYDEAHLYLGEIYARQGKEVAALRHWLWAVHYGQGSIRRQGWYSVVTNVDSPPQLWVLLLALATAFPVASLVSGITGILAAWWLLKVWRRLYLQRGGHK